jgi:hypothetical protein
VRVPAVSFEHLRRLSDDVGLFEHAKLTTPRRAHGYCLDDVARGLLVTARQPQPPPQVLELAEIYLRFAADAQHADGSFHNRRRKALGWQDESSFEDCWGRAVWALGTTVARMPQLADRAMLMFDTSAVGRSPWPRAMAFAGLGAAEVLTVRPDNRRAAALLAAAATAVGRPPTHGDWRWTQPRLHYANAALAETLLAAGDLLHKPTMLGDGLAMLRWLRETESGPTGLSVTPVGGWVTGEPRPGFDQQPIEIAALADAFARALQITGDPVWREGVLRCARWFLGENDAQTPLYDPVSGGGCDGLERGGRNENQGAESTLAVISTFQQAHRLLDGPS